MVSVPKAVMHPHFKWGLLVLVLVILFFFLFQGGRQSPDPPEAPPSPEPGGPAQGDDPQSAAVWPLTLCGPLAVFVPGGHQSAGLSQLRFCAR